MAQPPIGSRSLTGRRRYGLGWLPWLALALLLLLALLAFVLIRNLDDDEESDNGAGRVTAATVVAPRQALVAEGGP